MAKNQLLWSKDHYWNSSRNPYIQLIIYSSVDDFHIQSWLRHHPFDSASPLFFTNISKSDPPLRSIKTNHNCWVALIWIQNARNGGCSPRMQLLNQLFTNLDFPSMANSTIKAKLNKITYMLGKNMPTKIKQGREKAPNFVIQHFSVAPLLCSSPLVVVGNPQSTKSTDLDRRREKQIRWILLLV